MNNIEISGKNCSLEELESTDHRLRKVILRDIGEYLQSRLAQKIPIKYFLVT